MFYVGADTYGCYLANENSQLQGFSFDVIEALLAHNEKNQVRGAYNRASYKEQMRGLIEWYANYLDSLKATN